MGIPPDIPPHTMLQLVRRFNQMVYTTTSKNNPAKTTNPYRPSRMTAQLTPASDKINPSHKASCLETFPEANGRLCVRFITVSRSQSYHILRMVDPLIARNRLPARPHTKPNSSWEWRLR